MKITDHNESQDMGGGNVHNAVPKEERAVVRMAGEVVERVRCAAQHVQAGAHGVGVVAQRVHPVLLRHQQGVALSLLDEADEQGDRRVLPRKRGLILINVSDPDPYRYWIKLKLNSTMLHAQIQIGNYRQL